MNKIFRNIFSLIALSMIIGIGDAATITVDDSGGADYTKIQDAINAASPEDNIEVRSGTYYENLIIDKDYLGLHASPGATIDGGGIGDVVTINANGLWMNSFNITNGYFGIHLQNANYSNILRNNVNNNAQAGIRLDYSNGNNIQDNDVAFNTRPGIRLSHSDNNLIANNNVHDNIRNGIALEYSNMNTVRGNIAKGNDMHGIYVWNYSNQNTIINNIVNNNILNGIYISELSNNNILYRNAISDNSGYNAYDDSTNQWDDGISTGNRYSNYDDPSEGCIDSNMDNICDSPYNIPGGSNTDLHPITYSIGQVHNINKGTNYLTIQSAIDDANLGDEIHVDSGTYYENVIINKQLILRGIDTGRGKPIVDAQLNGDAITLYMTDEITLDGFVASNTGYYKSGIEIYYSNNDIIMNNNVLNNDWGISVRLSNNNKLTNNIANYNYVSGFVLVASDNNLFTNNEASNNNDGIAVQYLSDNNTFDNNIVRSNINGGFSLDNNCILSNNIISNNVWGISISGSGNILHDNIVSNNLPGGGIIVANSDNTIYKNEFIYNGNFNAYDVGIGINQWDNGEIGNHYSNFDEPSEGCSDDNGDGICDSVYYIPHNPGVINFDRYPKAVGGSGCGNTPSGQNIGINPLSNIDMIYDNVVQCGNTSATIYSTNQWSSLPNNYQGISFSDIQTTAIYSNNIIVNITYSDSDVSNIDENSIKMFHYENGNWADVTTSLDTANNKIVSIVSSLSPFAIAGPSLGSPTPTATTTIPTPTTTTTITPMPTTTPITGSNIVRGSSSNIVGIMVLITLLIIVSILRIRKN